jgi:hypothetical protein
MSPKTDATNFEYEIRFSVDVRTYMVRDPDLVYFFAAD